MHDRVDPGDGVHDSFVGVALKCRLASRQPSLRQNAAATGLCADVSFEQGIYGPEEQFRERRPRYQRAKRMDVIDLEGAD